MELLLFKKNPDRKPGHGGPEYISKGSGIQAVDPKSIQVGDKVCIVDRHFNVNEIEIIKIRWDGGAITYGCSSTLSYGGNPFGASPSSKEYELNGFPLFPDKVNAGKFVELKKAEIGHGEGGTAMCPVHKDGWEKEWRIADSYHRNWRVS